MNLFPTLYSKFWMLFLSLIFIVFACKKAEPEEEENPIDYQYSAMILEPLATESYSFEDSIPIHIRFQSATNEIVHNIKVEIFNKTNPQLSLYNVQSHVHEVGAYEFVDFTFIKDTLPSMIDSSWYCKASLWSHELDAEVISDSIKFVIKY